MDSDEAHRPVARAFEQLLEARTDLLTTNYMIVEAVALLQHRFGLAAVRDLHDRILPRIEVFWIDAGTHRRGFERMLGRDRRALSFVDCTCFEVVEARGLRDALAADPHFAEEGFRVLGLA